MITSQPTLSFCPVLILTEVLLPRTIPSEPQRLFLGKSDLRSQLQKKIPFLPTWSSHRNGKADHARKTVQLVPWLPWCVVTCVQDLVAAPQHPTLCVAIWVVGDRSTTGLISAIPRWGSLSLVTEEKTSLSVTPFLLHPAYQPPGVSPVLRRNGKSLPSCFLDKWVIQLPREGQAEISPGAPLLAPSTPTAGRLLSSSHLARVPTFSAASGTHSHILSQIRYNVTSVWCFSYCTHGLPTAGTGWSWVP